ncbi:HAD family hydrolase [Streptomyces sp. RGM 3693]|uniref:HAD family hydrolase n=1 Tax=Streptomyces sp. RGM 3693 TaxID=3413284 RepID=UPI003D2B819E
MDCSIDFDAVVFDLDGTLIDSVRPEFLACSALFEEFGAEFSPDFWAREVCGHVGGYPALFEVLRQRAAVPLTDAELRARLAVQWDRFFTPEYVTLLPGADVLLDELRSSGRPLAVASSSDREWVTRWLRHFAVERHFSVVVSGDDVARKKPDPMAYMVAAAELGVPAARCLAVEDSLTGMAAATGCTVVAVPIRLTRHLDHASADYVASDLHEVRRLLPASDPVPPR